jgi:hypothetical protein
MESDAMKNADVVEVEEAVAGDDSNDYEEFSNSLIWEINLKKFVGQKLQEYADIQALMQKHPEFKTDLQQQISTLSSDRQLLELTGDSITITNIEQIGTTEVISDTVRRTPFSFIINSSNSSEKDSLIAVFTIRKVEIDGKIFTSNKVTFEGIRK